MSTLKAFSQKVWLYSPIGTMATYYSHMRRPQTTKHKKKRLKAWGKIPFDMLDAVEESKAIQSLSNSNTSDLLKHAPINTNAPHLQLLNSLLSFSTTHSCYHTNVSKRNTEPEWPPSSAPSQPIQLSDKELKKHMYIQQLPNYVALYTAAEIGLLLKCLVKCNMRDVLLLEKLLRRLQSRKLHYSCYANIYALEAINVFKVPLETPLYEKLVGTLLRNLEKFHHLGVLAEAVKYIGSAHCISSSTRYSSICKIIDYIIENESSEALNEEAAMSIVYTLRKQKIKYKPFYVYLIPIIVEDACYFSMTNLTVLTVAFASFESKEASNFIEAFEALGNELAKFGKDLSMDAICAATNAFARAQIFHELFFKTAAGVVTNYQKEILPWHLSNFVRSYSILNRSDEPVLLHIWPLVLENTHKFSLLDIQLTLQACIKRGEYSQKLVDSLCDACETKLNFINMLTPSDFRFDHVQIIEQSTYYKDINSIRPFNIVSITHNIWAAKCFSRSNLFRLLALAATFHLQNFHFRDISHLCFIFSNVYKQLTSNQECGECTVSDTAQKLYSKISGNFVRDAVKILKQHNLHEFTSIEILKLLQSFAAYGQCEDTAFLQKIADLPVLDYNELPLLKLDELVNSLYCLGLVHTKAFKLSLLAIKNKRKVLLET